ncbi:MAG: sugar phosphate nucleotidyltransferase [archaeon]
MSKQIGIVYMVAGLSSRFGGKIKQFARVGPVGETLIEVSMKQAVAAGFTKIIFIVGEKTEAPFKEMFGTSYSGIPIAYAKQEFDLAKRDKPWGTVDALVSAKDAINGPFVVCNGDDIYGEKAFSQAHDFLSANGTDCVAVGYELGKVIPEKGKTNRGIFKTDSKNFVTNMTEVFDIEKEKLHEKGLEESTLCSMNLFGLQQEVIWMLADKLGHFKTQHNGDRKAECLLPVELSNLIKEKKISLRLIATDDKWYGVTNPEDEEKIRQELAQN